jgi:hypothetical protein
LVGALFNSTLVFALFIKAIVSPVALADCLSIQSPEFTRAKEKIGYEENQTLYLTIL